MTQQSIGGQSAAIAAELVGQKRQQRFTGDQAAADRALTVGENARQRQFQGTQAEADRSLTASENDANRQLQQSLAELERELAQKRIDVQLKQLDLQDEQADRAAQMEVERLNLQQQQFEEELAFRQQQLTQAQEEAKAQRQAAQAAQSAEQSFASTEADKERRFREQMTQKANEREDELARKQLETQQAILRAQAEALTGVQRDRDARAAELRAESGMIEDQIANNVRRTQELAAKAPEAAGRMLSAALSGAETQATSYSQPRDFIVDGFRITGEGDGAEGLTAFVGRLQNTAQARATGSASVGGVRVAGGIDDVQFRNSTMMALTDTVADRLVAQLPDNENIDIDEVKLSLQDMVSARQNANTEDLTAAQKRLIGAVGGSKAVAMGIVAGVGEAALAVADAAEDSGEDRWFNVVGRGLTGNIIQKNPLRAIQQYGATDTLRAWGNDWRGIGEDQYKTTSTALVAVRSLEKVFQEDPNKGIIMLGQLAEGPHAAFFNEYKSDLTRILNMNTERESLAAQREDLGRRQRQLETRIANGVNADESRVQLATINATLSALQALQGGND